MEKDKYPQCTIISASTSELLLHRIRSKRVIYNVPALHGDSPEMDLVHQCFQS